VKENAATGVVHMERETGPGSRDWEMACGGDKSEDRTDWGDPGEVTCPACLAVMPKLAPVLEPKWRK
jgi:hypothetical protein